MVLGWLRMAHVAHVDPRSHVANQNEENGALFGVIVGDTVLGHDYYMTETFPDSILLKYILLSQSDDENSYIYCSARIIFPLSFLRRRQRARGRVCYVVVLPLVS